MINTSEVYVRLCAGLMPDINEVSNRASFLEKLKPTEMPNEYDLIKNLPNIADNRLYTVTPRQDYTTPRRT